MKGITVHAPYSHLIAWGEKIHETRSWETRHRGWIAIHSGKSLEVLSNIATELEAYKDRQIAPSLFVLHLMSVFNKRPEIEIGKFALSDLPRGSIVAVANLTDCIKGEVLLPTISDQEKAFGFFHSETEQRWGWQFSEVFALPEPIPFKGQQGLFDVDERIVEQIRRQWREAKKGA